MGDSAQIKENEKMLCPVCEKPCLPDEIEKHVNRCIFLNCEEHPKRKRPPSPDLTSSTQPKRTITQKSPRDSNFGRQIQENARVAPLFQKTELKSNKLEPFSLEKDNLTQGGASPSFVGKHKFMDMSFKVPLGIQVQPKSLDDFYGQNHVLGKETVLRSLLEKDEIPNMILWGPPGCGKTSLSRVIHEICKKNPAKYKFTSLCAAACGVKDVSNIVALAKNDLKFGKRNVLFMDEIHRFNKKQQDVFLLSVERGDLILVGATTENPSFAINSALLSRCRVIVMEKLESDDLYSILENAAESLDVDIIDVDNPYRVIKDESNGFAIELKALKWLADISDGDARIALGNLQLTLQHCSSTKDKIITTEDIENQIKKSHMLYDRTGEEHYNIISAMHKSIRGSDPNAALYWTTRMIVSGEDPRYIARRMVRAASEDIGNADPNALQLACAIYLARAPKSREADAALTKAKNVINTFKGPQPAVPMHIRNAPTKLMKELGYGRLKEGETFGFMPPELSDVNFFN
ncbi:ATPase WRNIP1-like isoform X2 [Cylas formicarius]|uniref:ATPase WRNIP1-like isoform X2 n=1 Tax=Cylas formicarius TaxID=197179 RepID=UPI002958AA8C|nr:ATPase WRNIP1-like isoform X2 [Cylas formicarius]